jgi:hypothetical protein
MNEQTITDVLYLIDAWERGADAEDYVADIEYIREKLNVDENEKREHEPVAWLSTNTKRGGISCLVFKYSEAVQFGDEILPLYTHAPPSKPETPDDLLRQSEKEGWRYAKECEAEVMRLKALMGEHEPVAWMQSNQPEIYVEEYKDEVRGYTIPLYTAPPCKPWVDLTNDEAAECWTTSAIMTWKRIQDKLKEKNGFL